MNINDVLTTQLEAMNSGKWGTVGPHYTSASKAFAQYCGAEYGILCHTFDGAYEALLRQCGSRLPSDTACDVVITGELSTPANSLVALCAGAKVRFVKVCEKCSMVSPKALGELLDTIELPVRAVVIDYLAENAGADSYPLDKVYAACSEKNVPLIINAYGNIGAKHNGQPLTKFADAVVYSLESGSAIDIGCGGLITTDKADVYDDAYAYHNCGRSLGVGSTLDMDSIIGGDLRISEWNAVLAEKMLASGEFSAVPARELVMMANQPLFEC